jgi:hypothetical protein
LAGSALEGHVTSQRAFPIYLLATHEECAAVFKTHEEVSAMRLPFALIGLVAGASASAAEIDPTYAVRGSLGGSLQDFLPSNNYGAVVFFLNAGCLLLFGALAIIAQLKGTRPEPVSSQAYWAAR